MKYLIPAVFAVLLSFPTSLLAQHGGFAGGHMGGGFGHGGHSMSGHSGSHSVGHAVGHAVGHVFGHHQAGATNGVGVRNGVSARHGGAAEERMFGIEEPTPFAGAAFVHGKVVQLPGPNGVVFAHPFSPRNPNGVAFMHFPFSPQNAFGPHHFNDFPFGDRFFFFFRSGHFAFFGGFAPFPGCGGFFPSHLNCLGGPFFSNNIFCSGFFGGSALVHGVFEDPVAPEEGEFDPGVSGPLAGVPAAKDAGVPHDEQITLLQLVDGSQYGVTQYWIENGELHYVTNYGARNALPLDRIDLATTVQLNSERGVPFRLEERRSSE